MAPRLKGRFSCNNRAMILFICLSVFDLESNLNVLPLASHGNNRIIYCFIIIFYDPHLH